MLVLLYATKVLIHSKDVVLDSFTF